MRSRKVFVSSIVLLAVVALSATVVFGADMFSGTWKVNLAKSTYSPGPPPKSPGTLKITAVSSLTLTAGKATDAQTFSGFYFVSDGVNSAGQRTHAEFSVKFDGKDYPYTATLDGKPNPNAPDRITAKRIDDNTIELTGKLKGKVFGVIKEVVSTDGRTITATGSGTDAQGKPFNNTVVSEKQ